MGRSALVEGHRAKSTHFIHEAAAREARAGVDRTGADGGGRGRTGADGDGRGPIGISAKIKRGGLGSILPLFAVLGLFHAWENLPLRPNLHLDRH